MQVLRTPDSRFENLPDWSYSPHYTEVDAGDGTQLRIHHVDEGPGDGEVVLCMHGEPSWSYLYRHMIPSLVEAGHRVMAPDLPGFGRSDKPADQDDYTYERMVEWMSKWLVANDLNGITLVCQDWGGLIGLRLVASFPDRFARLVIANTGLPTGDQKITKGFMQWREFSQSVPEFNCGAIVSMGTTSDLGDDVVAAYNAPFPDDSYCAGARRMPVLVPISGDDPASPGNRAAWKVLEAWTKPVLVAFSDSDPITGGGEKPFLTRIPAAGGPEQVVIEGGGHFLQEDRGPQLAAEVNRFMAANP